MARLDKRGDPLAKIQGIIPAHDPPPSHEGNHKSALRKSRVLFPVRRSSMLEATRSHQFLDSSREWASRTGGRSQDSAPRTGERAGGFRSATYMLPGR